MELEGANLWVILGVALLIIEIFSVTFFAIFFGIGALFTGLLVWMGVLEGFTSQLIVFAGYVLILTSFCLKSQKSWYASGVSMPVIIHCLITALCSSIFPS